MKKKGFTGEIRHGVAQFYEQPTSIPFLPLEKQLALMKEQLAKAGQEGPKDWDLKVKIARLEGQVIALEWALVQGDTDDF